MNRHVICALDTADLDEALSIIRRLSPFVGAFKVGHGLTLPYGMDVLGRLRDAGADRIFLDLKFHDIPNSVALGVREAARHGVWMMTLHTSGGPAMMTAAVEQARAFGETNRPLLIGVSVLTSLSQEMMAEYLGVTETIEEHMVRLSRLGMECDLDGVVCSPHEIVAIRKAIGHHGVIVTPGIRARSGPTHDQARVADANTALSAGADYLVIGRALTASDDPEAVLNEFGLVNA